MGGAPIVKCGVKKEAKDALPQCYHQGNQPHDHLLSIPSHRGQERIPFPRFGLNLTAAPLVGEKNNFILYGPGEQGQCNTARNGPLLGDRLELPNMTCIPNFLLTLKSSINLKHLFV